MTDLCLFYCFRPRSYKRLLNDVYPPNATGREQDLIPKNVDKLAKYVYLNPIKLPEVCIKLQSKILKDLKAHKYGFVVIGLETFLALIRIKNDLHIIKPYLFNCIKECLLYNNLLYLQSIFIIITELVYGINHKHHIIARTGDLGSLLPLVLSICKKGESHHENFLAKSLNLLLAIINNLIHVNNIALLQNHLKEILEIVDNNFKSIDFMKHSNTHITTTLNHNNDYSEYENTDINDKSGDTVEDYNVRTVFNVSRRKSSSSSNSLGFESPRSLSFLLRAPLSSRSSIVTTTPSDKNHTINSYNKEVGKQGPLNSSEVAVLILSTLSSSSYEIFRHVLSTLILLFNAKAWKGLGCCQQMLDIVIAASHSCKHAHGVTCQAMIDNMLQMCAVTIKNNHFTPSKIEEFNLQIERILTVTLNIIIDIKNIPGPHILTAEHTSTITTKLFILLTSIRIIEYGNERSLDELNSPSIYSIINDNVIDKELTALGGSYINEVIKVYTNSVIHAQLPGTSINNINDTDAIEHSHCEVCVSLISSLIWELKDFAILPTLGGKPFISVSNTDVNGKLFKRSCCFTMMLKSLDIQICRNNGKYLESIIPGKVNYWIQIHNILLTHILWVRHQKESNFYIGASDEFITTVIGMLKNNDESSLLRPLIMLFQSIICLSRKDSNLSQVLTHNHIQDIHSIMFTVLCKSQNSTKEEHIKKCALFWRLQGVMLYNFGTDEIFESIGYINSIHHYILAFSMELLEEDKDLSLEKHQSQEIIINSIEMLCRLRLFVTNYFIHCAKIIASDAPDFIHRVWDKLAHWENNGLGSASLCLDHDSLNDGDKRFVWDIVSKNIETIIISINQHYSKLMLELSQPILTNDELIAYLMSCPQFHQNETLLREKCESIVQ